MNEIPHIDRYWSQGKGEGEVKETCVTPLDLPGGVQLSFIQIPPKATYAAEPTGEVKYVGHRGFGGIITDACPEERIAVGKIIYIEPGMKHVIKNDSEASPLEMLAITHKAKSTEEK